MEHEMNGPDPERDPLIAAAIRWADGEVPMDDVDWAAMRTNIRNRAEMPLARRRAHHATAPRWLRPLVPLAVAAGLGGVMWIGSLSGGDPIAPSLTPVSVGASAGGPSIQEVLLSDLSDQEFRLIVADRNDADELLLIAASQR